MPYYTLLPLLGTKTDVPPNDPSMLQKVSENVFVSHDCGGHDFDLSRKRNACSKGKGLVRWSRGATAQATKCLGLFELYDGTNRDHLFWDNGKLYAYDANKDAADVTTDGQTYQNSDSDLVSMIRVGSDCVFTDNTDGLTIQAWANGDANAAKAIHQYTEYKFRYLEYFAQRIIGAYSNQTNGDIDIRWSNALPTAQTNCYFESSAAAGDWQLYVPNDDSIVGIKRLGYNSCFIYSENSIHQLVYYPNFTTPFQIYTVVQNEGAGGHHSIVEAVGSHFFFNPKRGFVRYAGGNDLASISDDIEPELANINPAYHNLIVGLHSPNTNEIIWTVPLYGSSTPNRLLFYNYKTNNWKISNRDVRYLDMWTTTSYTWNNLVTDLTNAGYGASPTWNDLIDWLGPNVKWADIASTERAIIAANTDGHSYQIKGETIPDSQGFEAIRVEPILDFGDPRIKKLITECWFDFGIVGPFSVTLWHRSGDTAGEVNGSTWTQIDTVSCNNPEVPAVLGKLAVSDRFHQFMWGNYAGNARYEVNKLIFKYEIQGY